jgi:hypothetical protein
LAYSIASSDIANGQSAHGRCAHRRPPPTEGGVSTGPDRWWMARACPARSASACSTAPTVKRRRRPIRRQGMRPAVASASSHSRGSWRASASWPRLRRHGGWFMYHTSNRWTYGNGYSVR